MLSRAVDLLQNVSSRMSAVEPVIMIMSVVSFVCFQQRNLKQKFAALLRRFKVSDEVRSVACNYL